MSDNVLRLVVPPVPEMSDENMVYAIYSKVLSQVGSSAAKRTPVQPSANESTGNVTRVIALSSRR
ncbi:MAG: hypothetical protein V4805_13020 [Pseudomonadota bacterium]